MKRSRPSAPTFNASAAPSASTSGSSTGKRVKFSAEETGPATSAGIGAGDDGLEDDLETGATASSKKQVVTDGYDSDSSAGSDTEFGVGGGRSGAAKKGADGGPDDDDDDIFGAAEVQAEKGDGGKDKKKEFLEMGDIEGQEFGNGSDDEGNRPNEGDDIEDEEYYEEDDLANNDDAPRSRRSKNSMGYTLSSFNMKDELNEGRFSADGSYVANANDPSSKADTWLSGLSKKAIRAAAASKAKMDALALQRAEEEGRKGEEGRTQERDECWLGLLGGMRQGETVAGALARLGLKKKKLGLGAPKRKVAPPPSQDAAMDVDPSSSSSAPQSHAPHPATKEPLDPVSAKIDLLTHFASTLLAVHGELEVYDKTYSEIVALLKSEGAVRRDWVPPVDPDVADEEKALQAEDEAKASLAAEAGGSSKKRVLISRPSAPTISSATAHGSKSSPDQLFYRWKAPPPGQDPNAEFGPYTREQLHGWLAGGFFGPGGSNIVVRDEQDVGGWREWS